MNNGIAINLIKTAHWLIQYANIINPPTRLFLEATVKRIRS